MKLLLLALLLLGSQFRLVASKDCFVTNSELKDAIGLYKQAGCNGLTDITEGCETSNVVQTFGFPMNDWCFDSSLTDMSRLFSDNSDFNEISHLGIPLLSRICITSLEAPLPSMGTSPIGTFLR